MYQFPFNCIYKTNYIHYLLIMGYYPNNYIIETTHDRFDIF